MPALPAPVVQHQAAQLGHIPGAHAEAEEPGLRVGLQGRAGGALHQVGEEQAAAAGIGPPGAGGRRSGAAEHAVGGGPLPVELVLVIPAGAALLPVEAAAHGEQVLQGDGAARGRLQILELWIEVEGWLRQVAELPLLPRRAEAQAHDALPHRAGVVEDGGAEGLGPGERL
jgi:hypothetical protein